MRFIVLGTDAGVGKTRVCAALARALLAAGRQPTIVKLVQTGLPPQAQGDALEAGRLAGCASRELARFSLDADPWNAALDAGVKPLEAHVLADELDMTSDPLIIEGNEGAATPLNEVETIAYVAARSNAEAIVVIGLRRGCVSHALLTLAYLATHEVAIRGAVFVERDGPTDEEHRRCVRRALEAHVALFGVIPYDPDPIRSTTHAATLFQSL